MSAKSLLARSSSSTKLPSAEGYDVVSVLVVCRHQLDIADRRVSDTPLGKISHSIGGGVFGGK